MVVRIRFKSGPIIERRRGKNGGMAFLTANLLTLGSVSCFTLGLWRLCADLGWAGTFAIADGLLSHWQVWLAFAFALQTISWKLTRYGRISEPEPLHTKAALRP